MKTFLIGHKKPTFLCVPGGMEISHDLAITALSAGMYMSVSAIVNESEKKTVQILLYWLAPLAPGSGSLSGPLDFSIQKYIAGLPPNRST